jgi:serine protease Do
MKKNRQVNFAVATMLAAWATGQILVVPVAHGASEPRIIIDKEPIKRGADSVTSFAPVVQKAAPSVVTVYSKRTVKEDLRRIPFDDPFFRRFFGFDNEDLFRQQPPRERQVQGLGSGVIVSADGYILSNNHVVADADEVKIALPDDPGEHIAKVVGTDPQTDIAVLKVEAGKLSPITLTDSSNLRVGDVVLAVGNPFGVGQAVTLGIVSGVGRGGMGITEYEDFIQTDASINPGNSGGALVDAQGRLVGINTAILSRSGGNQGVGFAVPINLARNVMEQIVKSGRVTRGYLGVYIQPVTDALAREFNLTDQSGALVGGVTPDSPGDKAGLEEGDVITEFNGKKVTDSRHLRLMVSQSAPKSKATLKLLRDGKERTVTATLGELPATDYASRLRDRDHGGAKGDVLEGVQVADITPQARRQFEIPTEVSGALVINVDPDSPAAEAGLRPGDVILEIDRQKVRDADDAVNLSDGIKGQSALLRVWSQGGSRFVVVEKAK